MRKLKVGAVIVALRQLVAPSFLMAGGHAWFFLVMAMLLADARLTATGQPAAGHAFGFIAALFLAAAMVNTHRYLLLGELPRFRFGKMEIRYVLATAALYLPWALIAMALGVVAGVAAATILLVGETLRAMITGTVTVTVAALLFFRLLVPMMLALPARALGENDFRFRDGLAAARANTREMVMLAVATTLITLPLIFPGMLFSLLFGANRLAPGMSGSQQVVFGLVEGYLSYVSAVICAGALSLMYAGLVGGDDRFAETA